MMKENKPVDEAVSLNTPELFEYFNQRFRDTSTLTCENFICRDWNLYYNLYNPDDFIDPNNAALGNNNDAYEYYETPHTDNTQIEIYNYEQRDSLLLEPLIKNSTLLEEKFLIILEDYTFGGQGKYIDPESFHWAKIEIERMHKQSFTNTEFLKKNLCIETISFPDRDQSNVILIGFTCSWDMEHGVYIEVDETLHCQIVTL